MSAATSSKGSVGAGGDTGELLLDIPGPLKLLARHVVRGFYPLEEALIIDMLVYYPCLREDDLAALLKFDLKLLRAKIQGLRQDQFVQCKLRLESEAEEEEGKTPKVIKMNCYFINYKIFVNIIKYKLDHMRKKMETSERDATSRSSFKCSGCTKTFTDLEVDQLLDHQTMELRCSYCSQPVEEDESAGPQSDSRQLLAMFNEQMKVLYDLLKLVENVKLAPNLLEPEPHEIVTHGLGMYKVGGKTPADGEGRWSGEQSRRGGFREDEQKVNITFGDDSNKKADAKKDTPVWMSQSTVNKGTEASEATMAAAASAAALMMEDENSIAAADDDDVPAGDDEITSMLLRHEKRGEASTSAPKTPFIPGASYGGGNHSDSDKSDDSEPDDGPAASGSKSGGAASAFASMSNNEDVEAMSEDDDDGDIPTVRVGGEEFDITHIADNPELITRMSAEEKERYTQAYQDFYAHMYD